MSTPLHDDSQTFKSIFLERFGTYPIKVPDYQRAYSWEKAQINLFIGDLSNKANHNGYYFGHFIVETNDGALELVDGQQRLTTAVLFLRVCQLRHPELDPDGIARLLKRFTTVGYDQPALDSLLSKSHDWLLKRVDKSPDDAEIIHALGLNKQSFTYSQRRLAHAFWRFDRAFEKGHLERDQIPNYIAMLSGALCSYHLAKDKTVAVNIFEMHNTRGVPLNLIEKVKARLMKAVYDDGGPERDKRIRQVQEEFAIIYTLEEKLADSSFRREMTLEAILKSHLRVVDDGHKVSRGDMDKPPRNASGDQLIQYITEKQSGTYALALAHEFRKSVQLVCEGLPKWDEQEKSGLVGDVMILHSGLSCEFFLVLSRRLETTAGRISAGTLRQWEKLLFTHDFHGRYHRAKGDRHDFPRLFSELGSDEKLISGVLQKYLIKGFREDKTKGDLQKVVLEDFQAVETQKWFLNKAFNGWRDKVIYALYKYEISKGANIRQIMKENISVEHILPQEWDWKWIDEGDQPPLIFSKDQEKERELHHRTKGPEISSFINGLGNLLLVTREENSALGNSHPKDKDYTHICQGGSYAEHEGRREDWKASENWTKLIRERGEDILHFIKEHMLK